MATTSNASIARSEKDRAMDEKLLHDYKDPDKRRRRRRNVRIGFCVTFAILLITSLLNWGVVSSWGKVSIDRITLSGSDGASFSGLVYRPDNATDATPAPGIIMLHGNSGNARNQESWALEFARRGFAVVVPDLYGSGNSQGYFNAGAGTSKGSGMSTSRALLDESKLFYEYMLSLPYIDSENIIASGHSLGSFAAVIIGAEYDSKGVLAASGSPARRFKDNPEEAASVLSYQGNVAFLYGSYDLGNTVETIPEAEGLLQIFQAHTGDSGMTEIEPDHVYGSFEEGNAIVLSYDQRVHEGAFVDGGCIQHLLEYGQDMIGDAVPNYIDSHNQIWQYKDYIGLFGIFAFAAWLCATALLLIEEVPVFARARRPLARNVGFRGPGLIIACAVGLLAPYLVLKTDAFGIIGGGTYSNLYNLGFNMGYANMGFGVIIGLTIVCIIGSAVYILTERKKKGLKPADFGITPADYDASASSKEKAKSIALMILSSFGVALVTIALGWAYLQFQSSVLGTDLYAWFFGVKDIPLDKIPYYWNYLIVFILCFLVLSIDMNVIRRLPTTGNETKDLVIAIVVNVALAIAVVVAVIALKWFFETTVNLEADSSWLLTVGVDWSRIWGLPVGMTVAVAGSTFIYKKTGNLWLCALLIGTVACLMGMLYGSTRFHYLTFFYE